MCGCRTAIHFYDNREGFRWGDEERNGGWRQEDQSGGSRVELTAAVDHFTQASQSLRHLPLVCLICKATSSLCPCQQLNILAARTTPCIWWLLYVIKDCGFKSLSNQPPETENWTVWIKDKVQWFEWFTYLQGGFSLSCRFPRTTGIWMIAQKRPPAKPPNPPRKPPSDPRLSPSKSLSSTAQTMRLQLRYSCPLAVFCWYLGKHTNKKQVGFRGL